MRRLDWPLQQGLRRLSRSVTNISESKIAMLLATYNSGHGYKIRACLCTVKLDGSVVTGGRSDALESTRQVKHVRSFPRAFVLQGGSPLSDVRRADLRIGGRTRMLAEQLPTSLERITYLRPNPLEKVKQKGKGAYGRPSQCVEGKKGAQW